MGRLDLLTLNQFLIILGLMLAMFIFINVFKSVVSKLIFKSLFVIIILFVSDSFFLSFINEFKTFLSKFVLLLTAAALNIVIFYNFLYKYLVSLLIYKKFIKEINSKLSDANTININELCKILQIDFSNIKGFKYYKNEHKGEKGNKKIEYCVIEDNILHLQDIISLIMVNALVIHRKIRNS